MSTMFRLISYGPCSRALFSCTQCTPSPTGHSSMSPQLKTGNQNWHTSTMPLRANGYSEWALAPPPSSAKGHIAETTAHEDLCWDNHTWQDYQNSLAGFISHITHMYHKPTNTLCSIVVHPKDSIPKEHKCGTIYNIMCDIDSSHTYIGETKRTLSQRFKEHINQQE